MRILFTKSLLNSQKALIESFGVFDVVNEVALINTSLISYQQFVDKYEQGVDNDLPAVVSSLRSSDWIAEKFPYPIKELWAISKRTALPLWEKVDNIHIASQASSAILAKEILLRKYVEINFFCGNLHRPEIPQLLAEQGIKVNVFEVYATSLIAIELKEDYDVICFFSPSAVTSYFEANTWKQDYLALSIGATTALALEEKGVEKIIYPVLPGFENMLDRLKRHLELENGISRIKK